MGSIYLRKDGRYEGRCRDSKSGKTLYFYGKSRDEVKEKMNLFLENQSYYKSDMTVKMLFKEWTEAIRFRVKESTLANYSGKAEAHILPAFGNLRADELDAPYVQRFIAVKLSDGPSASYVADIVILLKSLIKFAVSRYNIRNRISEVIMPKRKKAEVLLLSKSQQNCLKKYLNANRDLTSFGVALSLYGFYALLYIDELIRSRNYDNAVILTPCPEIEAAARHFSKQISDVVVFSEKYSEILIRYFMLYDFDERFIIASTELPAGRNGSALEGLKELTMEEIFAIGVYKLYPLKKGSASLKRLYDAAVLKAL